MKFIRLDKTKEFLFEKDNLRNADSGLTNNTEYDYNLFEKIILEAKEISETNNSNFYIVFFLGIIGMKKIWSFFLQKNRNIIKKNNIDFIDIHKSRFAKEKSPLKNFPFQKFGHYNEIGYNKVAEIINETIKK